MAVLVLVQAALLVWLSDYLPGTFASVDASAKIWQVESLRLGQHDLVYPALALDPERHYLPDTWCVRVDGTYYTVYYSIFSYVLLAATYLVGSWAWNLVPLMAGVLTAAGAVWLVRRHRLVADDDLWLVAAVAWWCATLVYYSIRVNEHVLSALFAMGAFLCAGEVVSSADGSLRGRTKLWLGLTGVFLALAALSRGECYLLAPAVALSVLWLMRGLGVLRLLLVGGIMTGAALATLTAWFVSHPVMMQIQVGLSAQGQQCPIPLFDRVWQLFFRVGLGNTMARLVGEGVATVVGVVASTCFVVVLILAALLGSRRGPLRYVLAAVLVSGLGMSLIAFELEGLFVVCPLLLLPMLGGWRAWREAHPTVRLVVLASVLFMVLVAVLLPNAGGAPEYGSRYLVPVTAPLAVVALSMVLVCLHRRRDRWLTVMLVVSLAAGLVAEAKAMLLCRHAARLSEQVVQVLETSPSPVVLVMSLEGKAVYRHPRALLGLPVLQASNETELKNVVDLLRRRKVRTFTFVCRRPYEARARVLLQKAGGEVVARRELQFIDCALITRLSEQPSNADER